MRRNPRDIHGDGHGFVAVSQGGPPAKKREVIVTRYSFTRDRHKLPKGTDPFLGLYINPDGSKLVMIIWRAPPTAGLNFVTLHGSAAPHYVTDPHAWAQFPYWGDSQHGDA